MSYDTIAFAIEGASARLTLNRPSSLNSVTKPMHAEIADALRRLRKEDGVRCLILTGAGRAFSTGQDLEERRASFESGPPDLGESLTQRYNPLVRTLRTLDIPVIAAVNGVAAGAGVGIALACDIVLAARSAKFMLPFNKLGLIPDAGATWSLPRLLGQARAAGLVLTGGTLTAEQAESWGLIWKCVDDDQLAAETKALTDQLCDQPKLGMALSKRALNRAFDQSLDDQLALEADLQRIAGRAPDYRAKVQAFFDKK